MQNRGAIGISSEKHRAIVDRRVSVAPMMDGTDEDFELIETNTCDIRNTHVAALSQLVGVLLKRYAGVYRKILE
jgi:hypothetical protein